MNLFTLGNLLILALIVWVILKLTGIVVTSGLFWTVLVVLAVIWLIQLLMGRRGPL